MSIRYIKPKPKKKKGKFLFFVLVIGLAILGYNYFGIKKDTMEKKSSAVETVAETKSQKIKNPAATQEQIANFLGAATANYSYYVQDLSGDYIFGYQEEKIYTAASSIKVTFAAYIYNLAEEGRTNLSKKLTYTSADYEEGTGVLIAQPYGTAYTVEQYIKLMIEKSDNAATNVLLRNYGRNNVQAYLNGLGFSGIIDVAKNKITPKALGTFFAMLYRDELGIGTNKDKLLSYLKVSLIDTRLKGELSGVEIAHKIGTQTNSISDSGIVFLDGNPYVISVFTDKYVSEASANANIARISKLVYQFFTG